MVSVQHGCVVAALDVRRIYIVLGRQCDCWNYSMLLTDVEASFLTGKLGKQSASLSRISSDTSLLHLLGAVGKVRWERTQGNLALPDLLTEIMARVRSDEAGSQSNRSEKG